MRQSRVRTEPEPRGKHMTRSFENLVGDSRQSKALASVRNQSGSQVSPDAGRMPLAWLRRLNGLARRVFEILATRVKKFGQGGSICPNYLTP